MSPYLRQTPLSLMLLQSKSVSGCLTFKAIFFAHNVQTSIHSVEPLNDEVLAHVTFHGDFSDSFASDGNVDATIELATTGHKIHKMIIKLDAA